MTREEMMKAPFGSLGFSRQFCRLSEQMGFENISQIAGKRPEELLRLPAFSYRWLEELAAFLTAHNAIEILQPIPGKNYG